MQIQLKYYHTTDAQVQKKKKKVSFSTGLTQYSSFSAGVFMNHEYFSFR